MEVILQKNWFGPDGFLYRARAKTPVTIPDEFKDQLPETAEIMGKSSKTPAAENKKPAPKTLAEVDDDRKASDEVDRILKQKGK